MRPLLPLLSVALILAACQAAPPAHAPTASAPVKPTAQEGDWTSPASGLVRGQVGLTRLEHPTGTPHAGDNGGAGVDEVPFHLDVTSPFSISFTTGGANHTLELRGPDQALIASLNAQQPVFRGTLGPGRYRLVLRHDGAGEPGGDVPFFVKYNRPSVAGSAYRLLQATSAQPAQDQATQADPAASKQTDSGHDIEVGAKICAGCDMRGMDLQGHDFGAAELPGTNLGDTRLSGAVFTGANLRGASFDRAIAEGAAFDKAKLQNTVFTRADLKAANFDGAELATADFQGAQLGVGIRPLRLAINNPFLPQKSSPGTFIGADMAGADLRGADLSATDFSAAQMTNTKLNGANLAGTIFKAAEMAAADLRAVRITGGNFEQAFLSGATFRHATVTGGNFTGAILDRAQFQYARLTEKTTFTSASGIETDFTGATLNNCDFGESRFVRSSFFRADVQQTNFIMAILSGSNLYVLGNGFTLFYAQSGVVLDGAQIPARPNGI
jgi:uncharacterized protein YjbI with pentapeptide repeats